MTIEAQELVCSPGSKGYEDLNIKPVSFGHRAHELVQDLVWMYGARDENKRDSHNG